LHPDQPWMSPPGASRPYRSRGRHPEYFARPAIAIHGLTSDRLRSRFVSLLIMGKNLHFHIFVVAACFKSSNAAEHWKEYSHLTVFSSATNCELAERSPSPAKDNLPTN
jgi:hypothetical protein